MFFVKKRLGTLVTKGAQPPRTDKVAVRAKPHAKKTRGARRRRVAERPGESGC